MRQRYCDYLNFFVLRHQVKSVQAVEGPIISRIIFEPNALEKKWHMFCLDTCGFYLSTEALKSIMATADKTKRVGKWYFGGVASAMAACCTHPLDLLKV